VSHKLKLPLGLFQSVASNYAPCDDPGPSADCILGKSENPWIDNRVMGRQLAFACRFFLLYTLYLWLIETECIKVRTELPNPRRRPNPPRRPHPPCKHVACMQLSHGLLHAHGFERIVNFLVN